MIKLDYLEVVNEAQVSLVSLSLLKSNSSKPLKIENV